MGTWGASIFSSDTAADVRMVFREAIGEGKTAQEATQQLIEDFAPSDDDPEDSIPFWLALAATQHRCGRLLPAVRDKALAILDAGADLAQWQEEAAKFAVKRKAALDQLRETLLSPQRKPTRIKRPYHDRSPWEAGHAIAYRLQSGKFVVLRVLHMEENGKSRTPIVELCDWIGNAPPDRATITRLPRKRPPPPFDKMSTGKMSLYVHKASDFPADRLQIIATGLPVETRHADSIGAAIFGGWAALDEFLEREFKVS